MQYSRRGEVRGEIGGPQIIQAQPRAHSQLHRTRFISNFYITKLHAELRFQESQGTRLPMSSRVSWIPCSVTQAETKVSPSESLGALTKSLLAGFVSSVAELRSLGSCWLPARGCSWPLEVPLSLSTSSSWHSCLLSSRKAAGVCHSASFAF